MRFPRSAGVLCHITSLPRCLFDRSIDSPSRYDFGIGDLGPSAYEFADFLVNSGQTIWQVLPLGPPAAGNSPYSCYSAFAGNPLLISPQMLVDECWLSPNDLEAHRSPTPDQSRIDFDAVQPQKMALLRKAYEGFCNNARSDQRTAMDLFVEKNKWWLDDFGRFEALRNHFSEADWSKWPDELVRRTDEAIAEWDERLSAEIQFSEFVQFVFDDQWQRLKRYANHHRVRMYGDMPIFVDRQSADVWANQEIFSLDEHGKPLLVAGVPPDYFSTTGQLWGNPQYRWDVLEQNGYRWWIQRFGYALQQFDLLRVDHFRGFEAYWEIPATARTAVTGKWVKGPNEKVFEAARMKLGELPLIAEDLGMITEEVHELRDRLGFPGMRVFQFGFDTLEDDFHRPSAYPEHSMAYTGTHDNDTLMGWFASRVVKKDGEDLLQSVLIGTEPIHIQLIGAVLDSPSDTAMAPIQDWLGMGNDARMNLPGEASGNWGWRLRPGELSTELSHQIDERTKRSSR